MKFSPDPIASLRAFFDAARPRPRSTAPRGLVCACRCCAAWPSRAQREEPPDEALKPLGVGLFGIRARTAPIRYRELKYLQIDTFSGRGPGGHPEPTMRKMPLPDRVARVREGRIKAEIDDLVSKIRIPRLKLGSAADYREEVSAEAFAEALAVPSLTAKQAVDRAEKRFTKLYRDLT